MDQDKSKVEPELVDLTGWSLEQLLTCDDESLAPMVSRVLSRIDDDHGSVSGFNPQRPFMRGQSPS